MAKNDSLVAKVVRKSIPIVGLLNRAMVKIPVLGKKMVSIMSRSLGKVLPKLGFLGFEKERSYEAAVRNWEVYLDLVGGSDYEKEAAGPGRTVYTFHNCPAGFCKPGHLDACDATMECDKSLVNTVGARLVVEKRIPTDGVCVEILVPAEGID